MTDMRTLGFLPLLLTVLVPVGPAQSHAGSEPAALLDAARIKLSLIYDNHRFKEGLEADWGFSCLIEGLDEPILFDTGQLPGIFMHNMEKLGIDPTRIRRVFISHEHGDHFGGLMGLLKVNPHVTVHLLKSFRPALKQAILNQGAHLVEVTESVSVCRHALSTGEMTGGMVKEQALLITSSQGLIVVTGCSHPGVVQIAQRAKQLTKKEILLLIGGFHLLHYGESKVRGIGSDLKRLGVRYIAPAHCTGEDARRILKEVFGPHYIECGVGRTVTGDALTK
jgi:7,8-dihydropterin-6-yl-methyl-4-(beta-D-ribofuranosyl)aminobenzene 5'-phosphate synthase